jgi:hypothetical protein
MSDQNFIAKARAAVVSNVWVRAALAAASLLIIVWALVLSPETRSDLIFLYGTTVAAALGLGVVVGWLKFRWSAFLWTTVITFAILMPITITIQHFYPPDLPSALARWTPLAMKVY